MLVEDAPRYDRDHNIAASKITHTILVVPYYNYSIMGPKTLF